MTTVSVFTDPIRLSGGSIRSSLRHMWHEARPVVQVVFALRFLTGWILADSQTIASSRFLPAFAGWVLLTLGIYVINGVTDIVEDRANGSRRPLAAGLVSTRVAVNWVITFNVVGLLLLSTVSLSLAALGATFAGLGLLYTNPAWPWKAHWASAAVCCAGGGFLTFIAGAAAADERLSGAEMLAVTAAAAWMGISGACKDLADEFGDRVAGRKTLPVLMGGARAAVVIALAGVVTQVALLLVANFACGALPPGMLVMTTGSIALAAALLTPRLMLRPGNSPSYRVFMVTQYAAVPALIS